MHVNLKRTLVFVLVFALSQLLAYWFCLAGGLQFGTEAAGASYVVCALFGLIAGLLIAMDSVE